MFYILRKLFKTKKNGKIEQNELKSITNIDSLHSEEIKNKTKINWKKPYRYYDSYGAISSQYDVNLSIPS